VADHYWCDREDVEATQPTLVFLACPATPNARRAAAPAPSMAEEEIAERVSQMSHSAEFRRYGLVLINDCVLILFIILLFMTKRFLLNRQDFLCFYTLG